MLNRHHLASLRKRAYLSHFKHQISYVFSRSINYMGSPSCCYKIDSDDNLVVRLLEPSKLYEKDIIEIFDEDFHRTIAKITPDDQNPYRDIHINGDEFILAFTKDRLSSSRFDILILAYEKGQFV
jgi:hypothetical protein